MNEREKNLVKIIGTMFVMYLLWAGYGRYQSAVSVRTKQIAQLTSTQEELSEKIFMGAIADGTYGEYMARSLPSDPETARSNYQQWLLELVHDKEMDDVKVEATSTRLMGGIYQKIDFRISGATELPALIGMMHDFYAKDYLHRIRELSIVPLKKGGFTVKMNVDVIGLTNAPDDLPERLEPSYRVDADADAYIAAIMNRNLYEPPNQAPKYSGGRSIEAIVGRDSPTPLTFKDPEGHDVRFELAEEPPEFVRLDSRSGTLRVNSDVTQEFELLVRAIDSGYPQQTTEQTITVRVVDPPPPPADPPAKPSFDDASQTILTGLVQGREDWTAWMHVRTRDQTLKLKIGDSFEIGSLKGTIFDVTPRYATLEIDGRRFELRPSDNLGVAAKRSEVD
ncbi:cadherin repeat domain-containing protein [Rhodopirellula sp.]|nr:cadherin repeat domain-containing protein [Rhodopirellula sp.]